MSKLVDILERAGQERPAPLGFGVAARHEEPTSSMVVLGNLTSRHLNGNRRLPKAPVDAFQLPVEAIGNKKFPQISERLANITWGIRADTVTLEQVRLAKAAGCDFVAIALEDTEAALLNDDDLGKIAVITRQVSEEMARAIQPNCVLQSCMHWNPMKVL